MISPLYDDMDTDTGFTREIPASRRIINPYLNGKGYPETRQVEIK
jgi:hypothetical protein